MLYLYIYTTYKFIIFVMSEKNLFNSKISLLNRDCGVFVIGYAKYYGEGMSVSSSNFDA